MKKLIIFGTNPMGRICKYYFEKYTDFIPTHYAADKEYIKDKYFNGLPLISSEELIKHFNIDKYYIFVAVAYNNLNKFRASKFAEFKNLGYRFASFIHPQSTVETGTIGENVFIFDNCSIQPEVTIEDNVVICNSSTIGHETILHKHCYLAASVTINGMSSIGEYSFIGAGSIVANEVSIAAKNIVGAGSLILKSSKEKDVFIAKGVEPAGLNSDKLAKIIFSFKRR